MKKRIISLSILLLLLLAMTQSCKKDPLIGGLNPKCPSYISYYMRFENRPDFFTGEMISYLEQGPFYSIIEDTPQRLTWHISLSGWMEGPGSYTYKTLSESYNDLNYNREAGPDWFPALADTVIGMRVLATDQAIGNYAPGSSLSDAVSVTYGTRLEYIRSGYQSYTPLEEYDNFFGPQTNNIGKVGVTLHQRPLAELDGLDAQIELMTPDDILISVDREKVPLAHGQSIEAQLHLSDSQVVKVRLAYK